ncbi:MAG: dTDP-4-dehydrorhamnose reductase [Solirubrobacterales bacterium]|nr:dTDP-4-dehydrorhamnose reductase [Solirubrobacterales bacterium]
MKVLITGAGGMLGSDVARSARAQGHEVVPFTRDDLDVTDPKRVDRAFGRHRPAAVVNCAAWTDVDGAEASEHEAELVNGEGASFVASSAANVGAKVVYVSTDYVFDGTKRGPYTENDDPDPINAYGRTKLAGERATALATRRSFIVRTSWLFGPQGGNFVETMLRLGGSGGPVVVVHDQVGCPTYTGHLADGLVRLIDADAFGVHHMAGSGSCSWYEFAMEIFSQSEVVTRVMASTTDMMERPARRPANSVLDSGRTAPITLPDWQRGLADYLDRRDAPTTEEAAPARRAGSPTFRQPVLDLHPKSPEEDDEGELPQEPSGGSAAEEVGE